MLSNLKHWRLNDQEKMSNISVYNDLKDATVSEALVRKHTSKTKKKMLHKKNNQLVNENPRILVY